MKKLFVFMILCLAFLLLVPGIVSAEDENDNNQVIDSVGITKSGKTTITYGVAEYFQLTIPPNFTLDKAQAMYEDVVVSNAILKPSTKVVVNVTSENYIEDADDNQPAWRMKHESAAEYVEYHLHLAEIVNGNYQEKQSNSKVSSGDTYILEAHAEDFSSASTRKEAYLKFFIPNTETADYAGNYKDELEFTATIVACDTHTNQNP